MMKRYKFIYAFVALASLLTTACFDDPGLETTWNGSEIEFNASNLPTGLTENFVRISDDQTDMAEIQVNLVGTALNNDVTVNVEVDPSSTAIAGVHYSLPSQSMTIPAGEVVGTFNVEVLTGNISPDEEPDLVLNITDASGVKVSANYSSMTYKMRVICDSDLAGTYAVVWDVLIIGDGEGGASQTLTNYSFGNTIEITEAGVGVYQLSDMSFGLYPAGYGDTGPTGRISDNCNVITGDPNNTDQYGDPFTINGTSDPDNGTIRLIWSNTYGDGGTVVLTKQ
ncbi:DUF4843 domain-containing protein [Echinicola sp. 20G]|uniref:DUF4843 domain-containing protein n=1 Tax=Echinicola sp. 20G TaxID=2781961 RepID=UPI0019107EDF|nr:DUF4843 domain-containing protein [Echinicola sp. 20G]